MSYFHSKYTRRICRNKTIKNITSQGIISIIKFTDGTSLKVEPYLSKENKLCKNNGYSIEITPQIAVTGFDKNDNIIMATDKD